ncbi:MAG: hypothetical protein AAF843_10355 [Bacteroidota bacterium]
MILEELVSYFRNGGSFEEFCDDKSLDIESEVIEIYMEKPFNIDNALSFFEFEKTEGKVEYVHNDKKYFSLFDFYYFLEAIEESNSGQHQSLSDTQIAGMLFSYAVSDA